MMDAEELLEQLRSASLNDSAYRLADLCGRAAQLIDGQDELLQGWSEQWELMRKRAEAAEVAVLQLRQGNAVHAAITRALDEASVRNEVLRGMCIEVGMGAWLATAQQPAIDL